MGQAFMAMHPPVPPSLPLPCCTAGMNKGWAGDGDLQPSPSSGARFATYSPNPELFTLSSELVLFFYSTPGSVQLSKPPGLSTPELVVSIFLVEGKLRSYKEVSQLSTLLFLCTAPFPGIIPLSCPQCREQPRSS